MNITKNKADFTILDWFTHTLQNNYANFSGRARRKEYFSFALINFLISTGLQSLALLLAGSSIASILVYISYILSLATLLPSLGLFVRRMHDINKSGWNILWSFIPIIGWIILLVYAFTEGTQGPNTYGEDPKSPSQFDLELTGK